MPELLNLIDHPDPDARLLALAVVQAAEHPAAAVLPLLVLADRLAELGDTDRECRARRMARVLGTPVGRERGFGRQGVINVFEYLGPPDVMAAAALIVLTTPTPAHSLAGRCALLPALGLHRRRLGWVVDDDELGGYRKFPPLNARRRLHRASVALFSRHPDEHPAAVAVWVADQCVIADGHFVGRPGESATTTAAWHRIGWTCSALMGLEPGELAERARKAAVERRREARKNGRGRRLAGWRRW